MRSQQSAQPWHCSCACRPAPRSAHQAVFYKGFLYVFGGELTSPNQVRTSVEQPWVL